MSKNQKNENLNIFRQRQQEQNKALVAKAIKHIEQLNGVINYSTVSKVTYDVADSLKGEKGLTLAGVSTSEIYRDMVNKAKVAQGSKKGVINAASKQTLSIGDIQMNFHALRIKNTELKQQLKILEKKLLSIEKPVQTMDNINEDILKKYEQFNQICNSLVSRLLELELAYIDLDTNTLNVAIYDEVILKKEALEFFYKDKLDELRN